MQPDELAEDFTGTINKTVALILEGKHPHEYIPSYATLETYDKTPIFIPVDTKEAAVKFLHENVWGLQDREVRTRKLYMGGF